MNLRRLLTSAIFTIYTLFLSAQADYNNSITIQMGLSRSHNFMLDDLGFIEADNYGSYTQKNLPGIFTRWEHGKVFSVSFDLGINMSEFTYTPRPGNFGGSIYSTESTYKGIGYQFGTRGVFHLLENKLGKKLLNSDDNKYDIYIGLGIYVGGWSYSPERPSSQNEGTGFQIALPIIVGGRYYFSDRFGICVEATTYMNNLFNVGLSYRFETY